MRSSVSTCCAKASTCRKCPWWRILDADKEGFLRSETSLDSDDRAFGAECQRQGDLVRRQGDRTRCKRRSTKRAADARFKRITTAEHDITPETIRKNIRAGIETEIMAHRQANEAVGRTNEEDYVTAEFLQELEAEMMEAAEQLDFERAAALRDRIAAIRDDGKSPPKAAPAPTRRRRKGQRGGKSRVPRPKRR